MAATVGTGSLFVDMYWVIQGAILGFLELIGIAIALALYVSNRRARTDAGHYVYSPTSQPHTKTPKLAFVPLPLVIATMLVTIGVLDYWHGHLNRLATFICYTILWITIIGAGASGLLLVLLSRPVDESPPDTSSESTDPS